MGQVQRQYDSDEMVTKSNYGSIYTNKVDLERRLYKILGEPKKEYIKGRSVLASLWEIPLDDISKINKVILRADIYGM